MIDRVIFEVKQRRYGILTWLLVGWLVVLLLLKREATLHLIEEVCHLFLAVHLPIPVASIELLVDNDYFVLYLWNNIVG